MKRLSIAVITVSFAVCAALAGSAQTAFALSNAQNACVNGLNKAGAKVAKTQGKENSTCVKNAADPGTVDACVVADLKLKVAGAEQKTTDTEGSKCSAPLPPIGYTSAATVNSAAVSEELDLIHAVFGSNLDTAMLADKPGATCQSSVAKSYEKMAATRLKAFNSCKNDGLKGNTITNATQLAACISNDTKLKVAGARTKLGETVVAKCGGVTLSAAFPGCSTEAANPTDLTNCVAREVECHMCLMTNAMDGVASLCDQRDDGVVNQTCRQCGNGATEGTETCDDSGDSATCDFDCTTRTCGDGYANAAGGEACDTSGQSATCDDDCSLPVCGDGNLNESDGEICDDNNAINGDGCDNNCTPTACQNGVTTAGEECDDDNATNGDGCDANCTLTACGNGIITAGETCDDDNVIDGDGCDSNCKPTGCNNGIVTAGEACDTAGESAGCDDDCTLPACHDGNHNAAAGEQCDDGDVDDTDSCVGACVLATCGDGLLCSSVGCTTGPSSGVEICDNAGANSNVAPDACRTNCRPAFCGDTVTDTGETCDGGGINTPTCDNNCTSASCGDGFVNSAAAETCDTSGESLTCDANCTARVCGDGTVNTTAGETCDDGDAMSGDGCSSTCQDGPGSGEQDPQCPNLGELVLYSHDSRVQCVDNTDCELPRTCDTSIGYCTTVADLDSGWTGIAHDSDINDGVIARANLFCEGLGPVCGECAVTGLDPSPGNCRCANDIRKVCDQPFATDNVNCVGGGSHTCNCYFGAPFPLNSGGTHACVVNRFSEDVSGTANVDLGAGRIAANLRTQVFLGISGEEPCPVCGGKCSDDQSVCLFDSDCGVGPTCVYDTPGDGNRDGICHGPLSTHEGLSCDVTAENATFPARIGPILPGGGGYSIDCQPYVGSLVSGQGLVINLDQSTGSSSIDATLDCDGPAPQTDLCPCKACSKDTSVGCTSDSECAYQGGSCSIYPVTCLSNSDCTSASLGNCTANGNTRCSLAIGKMCANNAECQNVASGECTTISSCSSIGASGANPLPNNCLDKVCVDQGGGEGECNTGPDDNYCDGLVRIDGRGMKTCAENADCAADSIGNCTLTERRKCFLDPIVATGDPDPEYPVAAAVFCIPPTSNPGINSAAGLPGPGRVITQGAAKTFCASNNAVQYDPGVGGCP